MNEPKHERTVTFLFLSVLKLQCTRHGIHLGAYVVCESMWARTKLYERVEKCMEIMYEDSQVFESLQICRTRESPYKITIYWLVQICTDSQNTEAPRYVDRHIQILTKSCNEHRSIKTTDFEARGCSSTTQIKTIRWWSSQMSTYNNHGYFMHIYKFHQRPPPY